MDIPVSAIRWISGQDTGTSSKTMWAALTGQVPAGSHLNCFTGSDIPYDLGDFGRCYRLILAVPEWKARLNEVVVAYPAWAPFIREWETLERLYLRGNYRVSSDIFHRLCEESRIIDGWENKGGGSWERKPMTTPAPKEGA